jgi:DNA-binding NarL/FixJ family response regulator
VVESSLPDVILIEPKRLSHEGLALIQGLMQAPQPPLVIVLTSYHDEDEAMLAQELGISCYMLKEINSQALVDAIISCYQGPRGSTAQIS